MELDVTNLDNVLLLQTLYLHADPVGMGIDTYEHLLEQGETVEGLAKEECEKLLKKDDVIDYHNGKPLKLLFSHRTNGQIILSSHPYDNYHGTFRFLEAILAVFDQEDIIIHNKEGYVYDIDITKIKTRKDKILELKYLLENVVTVTTEFGVAHKFDSSKASYKSGYLKELGL